MCDLWYNVITVKEETRYKEMKSEKRIAELEMLLFALSMKDRMTAEDYETRRKWNEELRGLKENV